jgi:energy-coupling factor transporter ATP-binding protein EcfA2
MSIWDEYPLDYRAREIAGLCAAVRAGECAALLGLSGSGKSNLLGFLAGRIVLEPGPPFVLVDCNRLADGGARSFFELVRKEIQPDRKRPDREDARAALEGAVDENIQKRGSLCLVFDRFDALTPPVETVIHGNLRALRDRHKYLLTYIIAGRRPLDVHSELAELFFAHTIWLGGLEAPTASWSIQRFARRQGQDWPAATIEQITQVSRGYPFLLRAVCEAVAAGCSLELEALQCHPAVQRRLNEFWADGPGEAELSASGLLGLPLLGHPIMGSAAVEPAAAQSDASGSPEFDSSQLTAKEYRLLAYLQAHPGGVCDKDDLIRAVWPEDKAFMDGIRDDSLAQLVRRLRKKIEAQPDEPRHILTVPGRGYRFVP